MIQQTSIQAYHDLRASLNSRQLAVFDVIHDFGPIANHSIADMLKIPINEVTGRTRELVLRLCVADGGADKNPRTGKKCILWRSVGYFREDLKQGELF